MNVFIIFFLLPFIFLWLKNDILPQCSYYIFLLKSRKTASMKTLFIQVSFPQTLE